MRSVSDTSRDFTHLNGQYSSGPTSTSGYAGSTLEGQVTLVRGGTQQWTVPATGSYKIRAMGATPRKNSITSRVGRGASMEGTFFLQRGAVLNVLVGQRGNYFSASDGAPSGARLLLVRFLSAMHGCLCCMWTQLPPCL